MFDIGYRAKNTVRLRVCDEKMLALIYALGTHFVWSECSICSNTGNFFNVRDDVSYCRSGPTK